MSSWHIVYLSRLAEKKHVNIQMLVKYSFLMFNFSSEITSAIDQIEDYCFQKCLVLEVVLYQRKFEQENLILCSEELI